MICKKCGNQVADGTKFCGNCGNAVEEETVTSIQEVEQPKKFWQKGWFAWIMLFVFAPIGIGLLWINKIHGKIARCIISAFFAFVFISAMTAPKSPSSGNVSSKASSSQTTNKLSLDERRVIATKEVIKTLDSMPKEVDQVTKKVYYRSWGQTGRRNLTKGFKFNWYVEVEKDSPYEYVIFDDFTTNIEWIFWDKIIFSTDAKNVTINVSSRDKEEKVLKGGKLETYQVQANKVKEALENITTSGNPLIRFEGKGYHRDYKPSQSDLEEMKKALKTQKNLELMNYKFRY